VSLQAAKQFTSKIEESNMMVLKLGWDLQVLLSVKDAVAVAEILSKAQTWEEKYMSESSTTAYFAYPCEKEFTMKLVPDSIAEMARMAGKPDKK
jgi:hypothetical protein